MITATLTYLFVDLLTPTEPTPIEGFRDLLSTALVNQREADSLRASVALRAKDQTIDSLKTIIRNHAEKDSMRANAHLSTVDAMHKINSAIKAGRGN
ncbi:hypothetical protein [Fibrella aestuarina]|uniref:hypothetical protein n=1 Tax=Fibrella aestuarina TaxID=651143 RepID=UPI0002D773F6|nr:hypothetical protein [Fibrella aestuarina]